MWQPEPETGVLAALEVLIKCQADGVRSDCERAKELLKEVPDTGEKSEKRTMALGIKYSQRGMRDGS